VRLLADRSRATDGVLHAYGAVAVHGALGVPHDGELGTFAEPGVGVGWMTGNVVVDPGFKVLFANPGTVADLDDTQLAALREAARALVGESERRTPSEQRAAIAACRRSGVAIATASRRDRAALMRAAQPAEAALERDATTKKRVAQIAALARRMRLPALSVPRACAERARSARRPTPRPSNLLDGTYHVLYTRADARAFGLPPSDPHSLATLPAVDTRILEDGRWYDMSEDTTPFATYTILGNRLTVSMPQFDSVETFTFRRDGDTLYLKPVLPMERGDQFVLAGEPWHRVGPPIRAR
jgi:hypothetical protein